MSRGVAYRYHPDLGIGHIRAHYSHHRFPPHAHDEALLGLTTEGAEGLRQEGRGDLSLAGQVRAINAGAVHEGGTVGDEPWVYEALYLPPALLAEASEALSGRSSPVLVRAVLDHSPLAAALRATFAALRSDDVLAREVALTSLLDVLAVSPLVEGRPVSIKAEPGAVALVRGLLADDPAGAVRLDDLARVAGLSKFHLLRVFKAGTGFTPWQYQLHLRVRRARTLLASGEPPGQVAAACGFVDQSHLTRRFRQVVGVTPAAFATAFASARPQDDTSGRGRVTPGPQGEAEPC